jgi:hypothetical protein
VEQIKEVTRHQTEVQQREALAIFSQEYLAKVLPIVLEGLKQAGYFVDDAKVGMSRCLV